MPGQDTVGVPQEERAFDPKEFIQKLLAAGKEEASRKKSCINIEDLKKLATHFKIRKDQAKEKLVEALFDRIEKVNTLRRLAAEGGVVAGGGGGQVVGEATAAANSSQQQTVSFRKDKHTLPRILNLMLQYPHDMLELERTASRDQLQFGETNFRNPLYSEVADSFNDRSFNSGGLASNHPVLVEEGIDPEKVPEGVPITPKDVHFYFQSCLREFRKMMKRYWTSGRHSDADIWGFCFNKTDVLYMHEAVKATNNEELFTFCSAQGEVPNGGLDTAASPPPPPSSLLANSSFNTPQTAESGSGTSSSEYSKRKELKRSRENDAFTKIADCFQKRNEIDLKEAEANVFLSKSSTKINLVSTLEKLQELRHRIEDRMKELRDSTHEDDISHLIKSRKSLAFYDAQTESIEKQLENM